jgi:hypothetical protein
MFVDIKGETHLFPSIAFILSIHLYIDTEKYKQVAICKHSVHYMSDKPRQQQLAVGLLIDIPI